MSTVFIVGSGPAGLTSAIYCARSLIETFVIEGSSPGGKLSMTEHIENFPGFSEGINGLELYVRMKKQAEKYGAKFLDEEVKEFRFGSKSTKIKHKLKIGQKWYTTDSIILACGTTTKWLQLPNEDFYKNRGLSSCAVCDGPLPIFRDQEIYVVGGGDSAAEEALFLTKFAKKVFMLVRGDKLKAQKILQKRLFESEKIEILFNTEVVRYLGKERLEGLQLRNKKETYTVKTPGLFIAIGSQPNTEFLVGTGLDLDDKGYIKTYDFVKTNIPGVFAAGDVHDDHYRQAITAAGFGCMAAIEVQKYLNI
jgi:thioredoxin reductase (NADPH)